MTFRADLKDLYPSTADWAAMTGRDQFGAPTYAAATSLTVRLVRRPRLVRTAQGDQVVASATLHVWDEAAVAPEDKITLADGTTPVIASVERTEDELGDLYTRVTFL